MPSLLPRSIWMLFHQCRRRDRSTRADGFELECSVSLRRCVSRTFSLPARRERGLAAEDFVLGAEFAVLPVEVRTGFTGDVIPDSPNGVLILRNTCELTGQRVGGEKQYPAHDKQPMMTQFFRSSNPNL